MSAAIKTVFQALMMVAVPLFFIPAVKPLAAEADSRTIPAGNLEHYLLQSFNAGDSRSRNGFNHLGLLGSEQDHGFVVSAVLDGFPAHQAGLRPGDIVTSLDGQPFHPVTSLNPGSTGEAFRPLPASDLVFQRNGQSETVTVQPVFGNLYDAYRTALLSSVQQFSSGNKVIGYVRLWALDRSTDGLSTFESVIDSLAHCDGLIVDLRDSYGFINARHLDRFFPSRRSYFQVTGNNPGLWQQHQPERDTDEYFGKAMVVMQNGGTRGGMELLAYQLGRMQRAVTLGTSTNGFAGQVIVDARAGALAYQPGRDITVDGIGMEASGFAPEQRVTYPLTESAASDPQFEAAMMTLMQTM